MLTSLRELEVRRMFSLLCYLSILAQAGALVKNKINIFMNGFDRE